MIDGAHISFLLQNVLLLCIRFFFSDNWFWLLQYAISQLRFVRSGLHLVTYLDVGNFSDKSTETTLHEICVQVFLRFSDSSKPGQSISLIYEFARLAGFRKSEENLLKTSCQVHGRLFLWSKLPTYFDDVTTIENNRQVRVNIDVTLVAIFRIDLLKLEGFRDQQLIVGDNRFITSDGFDGYKSFLIFIIALLLSP